MGGNIDANRHRDEKKQSEQVKIRKQNSAKRPKEGQKPPKYIKAEVKADHDDDDDEQDRYSFSNWSVHDEDTKKPIVKDYEKYTATFKHNENLMDGIDFESEMDITTKILSFLSMILVILTFPLSMLFCLKIVAEYERAVVLRMGRLLPYGQGTKGPGLFFILPCLDNVRKIELRTVTFDIPPQEVLTRDSVTVAVDAVVYYRICNPAVSVLNVEDAARSTRLLAQTTLRNVLGTKDLAQILMDREEMSQTMQSTLDAATEAWGVKVERVEIKDVRLPVQLQRAMAAEAEATREARAKVIAATGEHDASKSLKEAARVIASSPLALQLRYLQTLCTISAEKNSTIIFPLPIDILQNMTGGMPSNDNAIKNWLPQGKGQSQLGYDPSKNPVFSQDEEFDGTASDSV